MLTFLLGSVGDHTRFIGSQLGGRLLTITARVLCVCVCVCVCCVCAACVLRVCARCVCTVRTYVVLCLFDPVEKVERQKNKGLCRVSNSSFFDF